MVDNSSNIQIFFDLMNGLLDPKTEDIILQKNIPIFVRKLNCFMACVLKRDADILKTKYIVPHVLTKNKKWQAILEELYTCFNKKQDEVNSSDGCQSHIDNSYYYHFEIEDYGILILGRKKPFDKFFKFELTPVINFFGKSLLLAVERKKLEDSRKEAYREKQLLRTIIDNIPVHVYAKNQDKERILSNKAEMKYLGYEKEKDVIGKTDEELFSFVKTLSKKYSDEIVMNGGQIINQEVCHLHKDNRKTWYLHSKIPLLNENNEITSLVGIALDVTEQKRKDEETNRSNLRLSQQEKKYRNILSNMHLGLIETNNDNRIIYCNQRFTEISGFHLEELLGNDVTEMFYSVTNEENKEEDSGESQYISFETIIKNKKGDANWWLVSIAPNYNDDNEKIGYISVNLDITNQKKLAIDLEKALFQAKDASKAKEQFLANMSHEIRTPLNGIIGMIRELNKSLLDTEQQEFVKNALVASRHLLSIVNNILDITKIEAGELKLFNQNFSLKSLIQEVSSILNSEAESKGLTINYTCDSNINPALYGDKTYIRQILLNILSNAIKFTNNGIIQIDCFCKEETDVSQNIEIHVIDTGVGMSKTYLKQFFKKFQQEDLSATRQFGGTGLGMYITYELVKLMNGDISVISKKGKGTNIFFEIPFRKGDINKISQHNTSIDLSSLKNIRILLVEDNMMNRIVVRNTLNILGIELTEAKNGREAINILEKQHFDLILMDIQMPILNGFEATTIIRNKLKLDTPIIALSANAFKSEIEKCKSIGMNDYIIKPYEEDNFLNVLIKNLSKSEQLNVKAKNVISIPSMPDDKAYDLTKLKNISKGDVNFENKMIGIFIETIPSSLMGMQDGLRLNDIESIKKIVHRIKPSVFNMGVPNLSDPISYIESYNANDSNYKLFSLSVNKVCQVLERTISQLKSNN